MKIDDVQFQKIVNAIVDVDYDYICLIDVSDKTYIMFNGDRSRRIPDFENHDYDGERLKNTYIYVAEKDRERLIHDMDIDHLQEQLRTSVKFCTEYEQISGDEISHKQDVFFYLDDSNRYIVLVRKDITELINKEQRSMEKLKNALLDSERAVEAKSSFLSSVSHDLRTPLNGVLGFAYAGMDASSVIEKDLCLKKIISSGEFLKQLINDTLDLSRNELGIVLRPSVCSLAEIADTVRNSISISAGQKGIRLCTDICTSGMPDVCVDKVRLQQIMVNLLSNAVKFTPENGEVRLTVKYKEDPVRHTNTVISVCDNGVGMDPEFIPHAFEPFSQQEDIQSERNMGTGLGLAIVKQNVEAMNGFIELNSESGRGTQFDVYLPLEAAAGSIPGAFPAEDFSVLSGKHVLVIEDNEINREVAGMILEKKDMIIKYAVNGADGVRQFSESPDGFFDAVIMDIRMPVMDGLEASRTIRALKRDDALKVPIIAMTANIYGPDTSEITDSGMNAYLSKPVVPSDLYHELIRLMPS